MIQAFLCLVGWLILGVYHLLRLAVLLVILGLGLFLIWKGLELTGSSGGLLGVIFALVLLRLVV